MTSHANLISRRPFGRRMLPVLLAAAASVSVGIGIPASSASAQITVFDPTNYTQNMLSAARALQQINNQIQSLQNQAAMLTNMAKNLSRIDFSELSKLQSTLRTTNRLMKSEARRVGKECVSTCRSRCSA